VGPMETVPPGSGADPGSGSGTGRTVAGLLLAAGGGTRLGTPKALVEYHGRLLVERGVAVLSDGGCEPVHVVLGAGYEEVLAAADLAGAVVVHHPGWAAGMGSSLRAGLASLPASADAVVVALVDQPLVTPAAVHRLRAAFDGGAVAAVATYAGQRRNPVLLARPTWADVAALAEGDVGARAYLRARPDLVTAVACDDVSSPTDIDTPEDLATLWERGVADC